MDSLPINPSYLPWWGWLLIAGFGGYVTINCIGLYQMESHDPEGMKSARRVKLLLVGILVGTVSGVIGIIGIVRLVKWAWG